LGKKENGRRTRRLPTSERETERSYLWVNLNKLYSYVPAYPRGLGGMATTGEAALPAVTTGLIEKTNVRLGFLHTHAHAHRVHMYVP